MRELLGARGRPETWMKPKSLPESLRSRPYPSAAEGDQEDQLHAHEAEHLVIQYG